MVVAHTYSSRTWESEPEGLPQVQCHPGLHSEFQPIRELSFPKNLGEGNRAAPHQGGSGQHLSRKPNQRPGTSPSRLGDNARLEKQAAWKRPLSTRILQRLEFLAEQEGQGQSPGAGSPQLWAACPATPHTGGSSLPKQDESARGKVPTVPLGQQREATERGAPSHPIFSQQPRLIKQPAVDSSETPACPLAETFTLSGAGVAAPREGQEGRVRPGLSRVL